MADATPPPVAYCAPGKRAVAALILAANGEAVEEIREHPWLEGFRDVIVCTPPEDVAPSRPATLAEPPFPWIPPQLYPLPVPRLGPILVGPL